MSAVKTRVVNTTTQATAKVVGLRKSKLGRSIACINETSESAGIDKGYSAFVSAGPGIIEALYGEGSYRLDVSSRIDAGSSWQPGAFVAHALQAKACWPARRIGPSWSCGRRARCVPLFELNETMTSMTRTPHKTRRPAKGSMYEQFDPRSYGSLLRKLENDPKAWLATDQIIAALVANSREPIPDAVLEHLNHRLDGTARKWRGRKKRTDPTTMLRELLAPIRYDRYLEWLQQRSRTRGLAGWSCIRGAPWWQGPPNERAARMVQARLMKSVDWRHVMNLVSKARS